ncbi:hypothetical protein AVEN_266368-1 [Araneus ventricosus]|uniref:Uncharacterized protein n=1 Tax=Araneus ventricosus TaxID=182803 RepID=A0A4Y2CRX4_ARAVE|nr:hypothetical protein AVEN_266368-1 [Araneus ventricosus]
MTPYIPSPSVLKARYFDIRDSICMTASTGETSSNAATFPRGTEIGIIAQTRNQVKYSIIGSPKELSYIVLPTRGDIFRFKKTAAREAKNQALEEERFGKFQLEGLKPSQILGEENVKVCDNNDVAVDINIPSCSTTQTRLKLAAFARTCDRYEFADRPALASSITS